MLKAQTAEPGMLKDEKTVRKRLTLGAVPGPKEEHKAPLGGPGFLLSPPVKLRGEDPNHGGDAVDLDYVCDGLQNIKVEKGISGDRAVKPGLQEGSPVLLQNPLGATHVVFTNASHAGIHSLPGDKRRGMDEVMSPEEEHSKMLLLKGGTKRKTNKIDVWLKTSCPSLCFRSENAMQSFSHIAKQAPRDMSHLSIFLAE